MLEEMCVPPESFSGLLASAFSETKIIPEPQEQYPWPIVARVQEQESWLGKQQLCNLPVPLSSVSVPTG